MIDYHFLIDLWIKKVDKFMKKHINDHIILSSNSSISAPLSFAFLSISPNIQKKKTDSNNLISKKLKEKEKKQVVNNNESIEITEKLNKGNCYNIIIYYYNMKF